MPLDHLTNVGKFDASLKCYATFLSRFTESNRSKNARIPSTEDYLETGMVSIATHTLILSASCFLNPPLPARKLKPVGYEAITKLLMVIPRLLNDIQSYGVNKKFSRQILSVLCASHLNRMSSAMTVGTKRSENELCPAPLGRKSRVRH